MIRIGTRASALALAQAGWVAERLGAESELVTVTTAGDREADGGRDADAPDAAGVPTDKSRWVSELERALLAGEIDVAVHSAKDVPAELPEGLELVAIPERADPRDAICGAPSLASLPGGARVGTSSLRRAAQIRALRDDIEVVTVRGNVDTRLRKLADGQYDALVLAMAGLARLGREADGVLDELVPAAGQGALALEAKPETLAPETLARLIDLDATACVNAERDLVHALGASCNTPVGAHARVVGADQLELSAWVGLSDGSEWLTDQLWGGLDEVGRLCAGRLLAAGADDLLRALEQHG